MYIDASDFSRNQRRKIISPIGTRFPLPSAASTLGLFFASEFFLARFLLLRNSLGRTFVPINGCRRLFQIRSEIRRRTHGKYCFELVLRETRYTHRRRRGLHWYGRGHRRLLLVNFRDRDFV